MKLTNRFSLPEPFVAAVSGDDYIRGDADFTATELIKPTRILALRRKHDHQLEEDASERVWRLSGQARHVVLERIARTNPERYLVEQRFETTMPGGKKISGQIDLYDCEKKILYDWKETSVWKFMIGDLLEWEQQANINLYLMRQNDFHPRGLKNIAILKDWKARKARFGREKDYPKCAIHVCDLPMWTIGNAQAYILGRIATHEASMANPPVCTKKERWQRDATYAVMRKDRKRAVRLFQNKDQAEAAMMQAMRTAPPWESKQYYLEERQAEPVRCLDFCEVQLFCDFGSAAEKKWISEHTQQEGKE